MRLLSYLSCGALLLVVATGDIGVGCGSPEPSSSEPSSSEPSSSEPSSEPPAFVTTIYPFRLILEPVLAGRAEVDHLLPAGASPHTHDLRPSEVQSAGASTALLYGAETLDGWAADLEAPAHVALLGLLPEASRLRMPGQDGEAGGSVDPHFWTDPMAVRSLLPALADTLCALDAAGCGGYQVEADSFAWGLDALDTELRQLLAPLEGSKVMLGQPFFRYFLHRYGIDLVRVLEPVPGKEATPRRIQRLADLAREQGVAAIFVQPQLPARAARAVAEAAEIPVVELDPLGRAGEHRSYADLLRSNARIIREALE